jgi:hypothetical protein
MFFVKYIGQPGNVGRFGFVTTGQILAMTIQEREGVRGDDDYREPREGESPESFAAPEPPNKAIPFPKSFEGFDLKVIPWESNPIDLAKRLVKYSKPDLLKMLRALKALGIEVQANPDWQKEALADAVQSGGIKAGWSRPVEPLKEQDKPETTTAP